MGFCSFVADGNTSIANVHSGHHAGKPVYLVQPHGKPSIAESAYEGYGVFGGHDAFKVLAENNLQESTLAMFEDSDDDLRSVGIAMMHGINIFRTPCGAYLGSRHSMIAATALNYIPDTTLYLDDNDELSVKATGTGSIRIANSYDLIDYKGVVSNLRGHIESGLFKKVELPDIEWPLKFSFNKFECYEQLPPAEDCPCQGFFYEGSAHV